MIDLKDRAAGIELLLLDVDGVLTDGGIVYTAESVEIKRFHVRDGSGLKFWHESGKRSAIISGRKSPAVELRARELRIAHVQEGQADKLRAFHALLETARLDASQVCAIGDDLPDLPVLRSAGLAVAVADACPEVRGMADLVTARAGGHGAVREAIEWLLNLQGRWGEVVARYS
jgi:3-deoxy-D-manno-octulosonate 8-phosphate phosphatase (KDO 8-P phosphatase)